MRGYQALRRQFSLCLVKNPGQPDLLGVLCKLLNEAQVVGTPGSGFGASGEGYFRLTGFGTHENTKEAIKRIQALKTK